MAARQVDLAGHVVTHQLFHRVDGDRPWTCPARAYQGDAGYDVYSSIDMVLQPGEVKRVPTNTWVDFPPGWWGLMSERSSQSLAGLTSVGNICDEGYRGEVHVTLLNTSKTAVIVHQRDRVGQLVLLPRFIDPAEHLLPVRGAKGYGSSGAR